MSPIINASRAFVNPLFYRFYAFFSHGRRGGERETLDAVFVIFYTECMNERLSVCGVEYRIVRLLGHGKGGYSYLAERDGRPVVLKQIHHEPCSYYAFGNKIEAERHDYERLMRAGVRIPRMLAVDADAERIVKEYIEGETVFDLVKNGASAEPYLDQVRAMAEQAKACGLNIDYFPTNFVVSGGLLYYVDYECNDYSDEWSFENWGVRYWSRTPEFCAYLDHLRSTEELQ